LCVDNSKFQNKNFNKREYDIMFSGQFIKRKMPEFFCEVAELIKNNTGKCKVLILGDGILKDDFKNYLNEKGVEFHFAGFVQQNDLPKHYQNAKMFFSQLKRSPRV
jgi:glycosyltransferase involved in cell wall biosynthesis